MGCAYPEVLGGTSFTSHSCFNGYIEAIGAAFALLGEGCRRSLARGRTDMNTQRVVFPTDFSGTSRAVLEFAESLVREQNGKLYIVHVEEPPAAYGGGDLFYGIPSPTLEDVKKLLLAFVPTDPKIACEHHLVHGAPALAITQFADSVDADLIVIGTHGRTGFSRMIMGSVAEAVVRHANCPVVTYKSRIASPRAVESASAST